MIEPKLFKNLYNLEHRKERTYDFNLEEYREFLKRFASPQNSAGRIIHIAGTNGKGSVAEILTSILIRAGYRTGTYTSPHILKVNERVRVDGKNISDRDFSRLEKEIYEEITKRGRSYRTYFEALTTLAFIYFKERKTDFAVIETGLGGRLDSTNVVESGMQVITKIGYDHTEILGKTLSKIAFEKAGIIKENSDVFTFAQEEEAEKEIRRIAKKRHSRLHVLSAESVKTLSGNSFMFEGVKYSINQPGEYQKRNSALCALAAKSMGIPQKAISEGIRKFSIEGRLETLSKKPLIIADGSHNPQAIRETINEVRRMHPKKRITTVSIFMADKDYREAVEILKERAERVILTQIPFFRCAKREDYREIEAEFAGSVYEALKAAMKERGGIILFIGSFYLVSHARSAAKRLIQSLHS